MTVAESVLVESSLVTLRDELRSADTLSSCVRLLDSDRGQVSEVDLSRVSPLKVNVSEIDAASSFLASRVRVDDRVDDAVSVTNAVRVTVREGDLVRHSSVSVIVVVTVALFVREC